MIKHLLTKTLILTFILILSAAFPNRSLAALDITNKKVQPIIFVPRDQKFHPAYQRGVDEANLKVQTWYQDQLGGNTFQLLPSKLFYSEKSLKDFRCGVGQECAENKYSDIYIRVLDEIFAQKFATPGSIFETWVIGAGGWAGGTFWADKNWGYTVIGDWNLDLIADLYPNGPTGHAAAVLEPPTKSSQIGTIAHELGHAFTLQHTVPPDDDDRSIMGQAFRIFPEAELVDTPRNRERSVFVVGNEPIKNTLLAQTRAQTKAQAEVVNIPRNLRFKAKVTCGSNNFPVPNVDIDLKVQYISQILARGVTDTWGETAINYADKNNISTFELIPGELQGQKLPNQTIAFARDTPDPVDNAYHKSFHFDQCPKDQKRFSSRIFGVAVSLLCGDDRQPLPRNQIRLEMLPDDINQEPKEVLVGLSTADGSNTLVYGTKPGESMRFRVSPGLVSGLPPPEPKSAILQLTRQGLLDKFKAEFIYPVCPSVVPRVLETVAQVQPNLEQIVISDQNSQPQVIEEPDKQQQIVVNPPADKPVTVDEVYSDGTVKQYEAALEDGDTTKIGGVEIKAKVVKKITKVEVNGKAVDFSDPENVLAEATLPDQPSEDGAYRVPMLVCFNNSDEDCIRTAYVFHLKEVGL